MTEISKEQAVDSFNKQIEAQKQIDEKILANVEKFGHTYMGVFADPTTGKPAFIYTIGLHLHGLPEIIMSGNLDVEEMHGVISNLASYWLQEKRAIFGDYPKFIKMQDDKEAAISVVKVDTEYANQNYTLRVKTLYPDAQYEVAQLLWPDAYGKLPFDDEYSKDEIFAQDLLQLAD